MTGADFHGAYNIVPHVREVADLVVTGTSWTKSEQIKDCDVPVFYNPDPSEHPSLDSVITHKANIINKAKLTLFYESQSEQASTLSILCPNCKVVKV